ncbi:phytanoyl-CoA dioxygenase family protein [Bradyrhizobium archetypum]|uniref:Phytanoyl-CoA dioxygenase family protein n=1 Tax=Bradyrhizobium archetypum TaxID=2721160 RepID=A0A7Y4H6M6_9BRAD|nr:phytanoyl-CoA dioxygenase family protein [Bradyrhizobium archetypum]NOJ48338.1 phytanoyl-CoA dioxygenase family protein [Bradyrhizobium archetypum]
MSGSSGFAVEGFTTIPALFEERNLREIERQVQRQLSLPHDPIMNRVGNDLIPLRWNDAIVTRLLEETSALDRIRSAVAAADLRWISAYISSKGGSTPALLWHQDWWCWDHAISFAPAAPQIAVLCYLSDTDRQTGALRVLPGSHRRGLPIHAELPEPHSAAAEQLAPDHPALGDHEGQVTLSLSRGDAAVVDYRLLHGTHPNRSLLRRDALLLSFAPNWRSLPESIRAHLAMHPALPSIDERPAIARWGEEIFPRYDGTPASLQINRVAPLHG